MLSETETRSTQCIYNIAIDVQPLYSSHCYRGIGNYVFNLLKTMFQVDKTNNYYLVNFYGEVSAKAKLSAGDNVHELNYYEEVSAFLSDKVTDYSHAYFRNKIKEIIEKYDIEIYQICAGIDQYDIYEKEDFNNVKLINFVYDLIPLIFNREYLKSAYAYKYLKDLQLYFVSDYIFSDSKSARNDLIKYLYIDPKRILPIYSGISPVFKRVAYTKEQKENLLKKYRIRKEYILCVGADDFRKNLDSLVKAYIAIPRQLLERYQLVITCAMTSKSQERLEQYAKNRGWGDRVIITNYVNDDDMLCLLNCAKIAAFPSLYEGFGLPVVEAWKCGIPVLTSNNSSLGEIAGDSAITVNPFSVRDIRRGIVYALTEANLSELANKGERECQKYKWINVANKVIQTYGRIVDTRKVERDPSNKKVVKLLKKRCMKYIKWYIRIEHSLLRR